MLVGVLVGVFVDALEMFVRVLGMLVSVLVSVLEMLVYVLVSEQKPCLRCL